MIGGAAAGSSRAYRLDPHILPARAPGGAAGTTFIIDRDQAIVRRPPAGGRATTLAVPLSAYAGVAVRLEPADGGGLRAIVELLHDDPALTVRLVVADEPETVEADWQAWGRALNLPLIVVAPDGTVTASAEASGGLRIAPATPRRGHAFFGARRPRFLVRRKPGRRELMVKIAGREIIARR